MEINPIVEEQVTEIDHMRLAKADYNYLDLTPGSTTLAYSRTYEPDKLQIPTKWPDLIRDIRFYYEHDPIASITINKFTDIGVNEINNNQGKTSDEVYEVYESFKDQVLHFLKEMALEYNLSGLLVAERTLTTKEINGKPYTVPDVLWLRDPAVIVAKKTPIPNRIKYFVEIDSDTIDFIMNKGKYSDGTNDKETYELLVNEFPGFVAAVRRGDTQVPLDDPYIIITRAQLPGRCYPTPYLKAVLEALMYKRKLRKMDYSIAARVISAIQVVTLGNDMYPLTEGDEDQVSALKSQMRNQGRENNIERVFQLFGNHTLKLDWVFPDTKAMLDKTKYDVANQDIMFGLGFPRILLSGETEKSATSNPEFAMFSPSESLKAMRADLMPFVRKLYKEIADLNGFDVYPTLEFGSLNLYDVEKMANVVDKLLSKASLSRTSALKAAGFKIEDEVYNLVRERKLLKENDIPEFLAQPFSPKPSVPGQPATQQSAPANQGDDK